MERSAPGHHGYPHALDLIRVSAHKRYSVEQEKFFNRFSRARVRT